MLLEILLNQRKGHQVKQGAGQEAPRSRRAQDENRLRVPNVSWKLPGGALHGVLPGAQNDGQRVQSGALEPPNVDHVRRRGTPGAPVGGLVGVVESHAAEAEDEKQASDLDTVVADPESAPNPGVHQNTGPRKKNAETGVVTRMRKRRSTETGTARRNPQKKPKWFEITMRRRSRLRRTSAVAMMTTAHLALPALQMIQTSRVLIWT